MKNLHIDTNCGVAGYITLDIFNPETGESRTYGPFKNLITNAGMDALAGWQSNGGSPWNGNFGPYIAVGSSGATPTITDTTLGGFVSAAGSPISGGSANWNSAGNYWTATFSAQFGQGSAAGNLAEIGFAQGSTSTSTLNSHALILDTNGNPTVVVVTAIEILTVNYEFRVYPNMTDQTGSITLNGNPYTWTARPSQCSTSWSIGTVNPCFAIGCVYPNSSQVYFGGALGPTSGVPSGSTQGAPTASVAAYTNGSYTNQWTYAFSINQVNGSITAITASTGQGWYQFGFSPAIVKDNTMTFSITLSCSWSRA